MNDGSPHHLDIVAGALFEPLRLEQFPVVAERLYFIFEVPLDGGERRLHLLAAHRVVAGGKDTGVFQFRSDLARNDLLLAQPVHLVAEEFDADGDLRVARGKNLHDVAAHAEGGTGEIDVFALVLQFDEATDKVVARERIAWADGDGEVEVLLRRTQAIDAGNRGNDEHVAALAQRGRRRVAELIDLVVHRHILFDVGIRAGDIAFRLVIVIVRHEVFHAVVRKKFAELVAKLGGERFVVRDDEGRTVDVFDDVRHRERFTAARYAYEHLRADPVLHPFGQFFDRLRLIARRLIRRYEFKFIHITLLQYLRTNV